MKDPISFNKKCHRILLKKICKIDRQRKHFLKQKIIKVGIIINNEDNPTSNGLGGSPEVNACSVMVVVLDRSVPFPFSWCGSALSSGSSPKKHASQAAGRAE